MRRRAASTGAAEASAGSAEASAAAPGSPTSAGAGSATDTRLAPGSVLARIGSFLPSLLPAEQAVAETMLARPSDVIEMSSQQLAEASGASRATVVRACQRLGFTGYQQLRVMLARDVGSIAAETRGQLDAVQTPAGAIYALFDSVGLAAPTMPALLDERELTASVRALATARQVVVIGNGLSSALAGQAAQRFTAIGRGASAPTDPLHQQVTAGQLGAEDVLLVVSGSGANGATVRAAEAARHAGACVIVVTAFARSVLTDHADHVLVVGMRDATFMEELTVTTRIPQTILIEALGAAVARELGASAAAARARTLELIADNLVE